MAHVLIGFAEALPAPEVVFSLRKAGHQVSAFARSEGLPLAHLPLETLHTIPDPEENFAGAASALRSLMAAPCGIDILLPLDDLGLWLANEACPSDACIAGATRRPAEIALDKEAQIKAALAAGLDVPETEVFAEVGEFEKITQFPSILKPALAVAKKGRGLTKGGVYYLLRPDDIITAQTALQDEPGPFLLQPLIHGDGEGVFGFVTETGVSAWSGHRRLRMMNPHGSGSSACRSQVPDHDLRRQIIAFLTDIGWQGSFMMEFLRDAQGTAWFMELNGRQWGSMALARRQGLEYPAWNVAQCAASDFVPVDPPLAQRPLVVRHLGRDLLHLLFVLRGPKSNFHQKTWPGFFRSLVGVFAPASLHSFYNYDSKHRSYFLRDALWTILKTLKR